MWFFWALFASSLLVLSCALFADRITFADSRQFHGVFTPSQDTIDLLLPADVLLTEVVVQEGDIVAKSQRLAVFDQTRLMQRAAELRGDHLANTLQRDCLLNKEALHEPDFAAIVNQQETRLSVQTALRSCRILHQENSLARHRLLERRSNLQTRSALAFQELLMRAQRTDDDVRQILKLRAALERQGIETEIREIELDLATTITRQEAQLVTQVTSLKQQAQRLQETIVKLENFAKNPWMTAPQPGRIARVRPLQPNQIFASDTVLVQLEMNQRDTHSTHIDIPWIQARSLETGDAVSVRLAGMQLFTPDLLGHITDISDVRGMAFEDLFKRIEVSVTSTMDHLAPDTLQAYRNLQFGTGQSAMTVTFFDNSLREAIGETLQGVWSYF